MHRTILRSMVALNLRRLGTCCLCALAIAPLVAHAVESEKMPIYTNTPNGLLCGNSALNQCVVPAKKRLIIEFISGYAFQPPSGQTDVSVSMTITDARLGLNGVSFHTFRATKTNATGTTDVFTFGTPARIMLNPGATFYFSGVAASGIAISGYLVPSP
jgi:hypothetical protein